MIRSDVPYRELAVHPTGKNLLNNLTQVAFLSLGFFRSMDGRAPIDELVRLQLCFHTYFQFESPCTTSTVVQGSTVTSSASETPSVVLNLIKYTGTFKRTCGSLSTHFSNEIHYIVGNFSMLEHVCHKGITSPTP